MYKKIIREKYLYELDGDEIYVYTFKDPFLIELLPDLLQDIDSNCSIRNYIFIVFCSGDEAFMVYNLLDKKIRMNCTRWTKNRLERIFENNLDLDSAFEMGVIK